MLGKKRPAKTKLFPAILRAVLVTFVSSENLIVTPHSFSQFRIFRKIFEIFRNIIIWILNSLEMEISKIKKLVRLGAVLANF